MTQSPVDVRSLIGAPSFDEESVAEDIGGNHNFVLCRVNNWKERKSVTVVKTVLVCGLLAQIKMELTDRSMIYFHC